MGWSLGKIDWNDPKIRKKGGKGLANIEEWVNVPIKGLKNIQTRVKKDKSQQPIIAKQ